MGVAGSRQAELRTALQTGAYGLALGIAEELPHVGLHDAIRLTLLSAEHDPERFDSLARRCVVRLIEELRLSLNDVLWVVQRLQDARQGFADAEAGLMNLLRQKDRRS